MHELSIAQSIVEIVQQYVPSGGARSVRSVKLKIGELAGVVADSLVFGFEVTSQGTVAEGAELMIERVPIVCRCQPCGSVFEVGRYVFICPACKAASVDVIAGNELDVVELELD